MDLQGLRDYVRVYLDVDDEELPDVILDTFISEGAARIINRDGKWPFLQARWSFTTTPGLNAYEMTTVGPDIDEIHSVQLDDGTTLLWAGQDDSEALFNQGYAGTGTPYQYSVWANALYLWPVPQVAQTVTVRGYRVPLDFVAGGYPGATPDLPTEFHSLIARYALASSYEQQEDPEMAALHKAHFEDELMSKWNAWTSIPTAAPLVLNSRSSRSRTPSGPLRFPFD